MNKTIEQKTKQEVEPKTEKKAKGITSASLSAEKASPKKASKTASKSKTETSAVGDKSGASSLHSGKIVAGKMVRRPRLIFQKTYSLRASDMNQSWWIVDAKGLVLGRMASIIAAILRGKMKPEYTPHLDSGDGVIVINARDVALTGNKRDKKIYYRHTGYPGGLKEEKASFILQSKNPERLVILAVKRMVGRGPMARLRLSHLRVYPGEQHPHDGLKPQNLDIASMNRKNVKVS